MDNIPLGSINRPVVNAAEAAEGAAAEGIEVEALHPSLARVQQSFDVINPRQGQSLLNVQRSEIASIEAAEKLVSGEAPVEVNDRYVSSRRERGGLDTSNQTNASKTFSSVSSYQPKDLIDWLKGEPNDKVYRVNSSDILNYNFIKDSKGRLYLLDVTLHN